VAYSVAMNDHWIVGGIQAVAAFGFLSAGCQGLIFETSARLLTPFTATRFGYRSPIAAAITSLFLGLMVAMSSVATFVTVNATYPATALAIGIFGVFLAAAKERADLRAYDQRVAAVAPMTPQTPPTDIPVIVVASKSTVGAGRASLGHTSADRRAFEPRQPL
jgi:hypothetical protein